MYVLQIVFTVYGMLLIFFIVFLDEQMFLISVKSIYHFFCYGYCFQWPKKFLP